MAIMARPVRKEILGDQPSDLRATERLQARRFGDCMIWHAQALHATVRLGQTGDLP
jgi:hypothetical protein